MMSPWLFCLCLLRPSSALLLRPLLRPRLPSTSILLVRACIIEDRGSTATQKLSTVTAARLEAERAVATKFDALRAAPGSGSAAMLDELRIAQASLSELRYEEQRRQCEEELSRSLGGAAAADTLDTLARAGVAPDEACYREALRACGADGETRAVTEGGSSEDPSEWAQLLFEEAVGAGCASPALATLALRACVFAKSPTALTETLASAVRCGAAPPPRDLEWISLLTGFQDDRNAGDISGANDSAAHQKIAQHLASSPEYVATCWEPRQMRLQLRLGLSTTIALALVAEVLQDVLHSQMAAGPARSTITGALNIQWVGFHTARSRGPSLEDSEWGHGQDADATWKAALSASAGAVEWRALLDERLAAEAAHATAASVAVALENRYGWQVVKEPAALPVLSLQQAGLETFVLAHCMQQWNRGVEELKNAAHQKEVEESQRRQEEERGEKAAEERLRKLAERRQRSWARRNEAATKQQEQQRVEEKSSMAVAIDDMVEQIATELWQEPTGGAAVGKGARGAASVGLGGASSGKKRAGGASARSHAAGGAADLHAGKDAMAPQEVPSGSADTGGQTGGEHVGRSTGGSADGDVSQVHGVGPKRALQLRAAGLATVGALAELSREHAEAVAKDARGLSSKTLWACREAAREMMGL